MASFSSEIATYLLQNGLLFFCRLFEHSRSRLFLFSLDCLQDSVETQKLQCSTPQMEPSTTEKKQLSYTTAG